MFGISGERLTMRIRQMTFKALLRQVINSRLFTKFVRVMSNSEFSAR
jgi:hypothetical protein